MVRRTKEEALVTRSRILDAAELVFERRGVSRTSLNEIALAAGLTRGAIYWHFADKSDLFNAMMERVTLPLEETLRLPRHDASDITLSQLQAQCVALLRRVVNDPQVKRVLEIATHKVEYVDEMAAVRARQVAMRNGCLADVELALGAAMRRGELPRRLSSRTAAHGLLAVVDGLLQGWMLDPEAFDLVKVGRAAAGAYLAGLGAAVAAPARPARRPLVAPRRPQPA